MEQNFRMNYDLEIDIDEVEEFINSPKFADFLLNNTTNFTTAAAILTFCYNGLAAARSEAEEERDEPSCYSGNRQP